MAITIDDIVLCKDGRLYPTEFLENYAVSIDFSASAKDGNPLDDMIVKRSVAMLSQYGGTPGYHGTMVVIANLINNKLLLTSPADSRGLVMKPEEPFFVDDIDGFTTELFEIATSKHHDGAVVVNPKTSELLAYNVYLHPIPFSPVYGSISGSCDLHDGTKRGAAMNFSRYSWIPEILTASEVGSWRRYVGGEPKFDSIRIQ